MRGSVTVPMNASPHVVWDLVSDITRVGEFSPETIDAKWVGGATGPAPDAQFKGQVKRNGRGPTYWSRCRVTACEPERVFEFEVIVGGKPLNRWRYQLSPTADGTEVTESFELPPTILTKLYWGIAGRRRKRANEQGMEQTLTRIKAIAEATDSPSSSPPSAS